MNEELNGNVKTTLHLPKKGRKNHYIGRDIEELESNFEFHLTQKNISTQVISAIKREKPLNPNALKEELDNLAIINSKIKNIRDALLRLGIEKGEDTEICVGRLKGKIKEQADIINNMRIANFGFNKNVSIEKYNNAVRCKNEYEAELVLYKNTFTEFKALSLEKNIPEILMIIQKCYAEIDSVRNQIRAKIADKAGE